VLVRTIATDKLIIELVSQYMGERTVPDIGTFEMMLENNPNCGLPVKTVEAQRQDLIEEICALLRSPSGDGRGGRYYDTDLKTHRRNVLAYQSKEQLLQRKANIIEAQRLQKLTPAAIRAEQAAQRKVYIETHLPPEVTREKLLASVELMKFWLRWELQNAARKNAVNNRLAGRG